MQIQTFTEVQPDHFSPSELAGGANHSRLTSITYPNGKVLNYNYAAGLDDAISRLSSLSDNTGTLESYDYLGEAVVVSRKHPQPGVDLSYIKRAGEANGDAGDPYTGLDRFGRIVDQRWLRSSDGSAVDRLQYTYDRNGNRLSRTNLIDAAFSESYSYDNLNQLTGFTRGSHNRSWDYDAQGNWQSVTTNGDTQTRSHNAQNEITGISGATTPTFDANGNMTGDETGRQFVYDAWNRLVAVKDAGGATLKTYAYDGLHRRISETASGTTTDLYYSAAWQVLEERVASGGTSVPRVQYIWSPVYVDALILRDRDTNADGTLDERLYVVQDANYNVTALFDNAGNVVERYAYDPFGQVTVLDAGWNVLSTSAFGWLYLHQGGRFDATSGLYHFRFRDYSPTLGRWTSLDPLGYEAGDVNLYRTVFNAPTIYTDPSGQIIPLLIIGGAVLVGGGWLAGEAMYHSYQTSGTLFDGEIWGAAGDGLVIGAQANVNAIPTAGRSLVTLGIWNEPWEVWAVADEDRPYYDTSFQFARFGWELLPTAGIGRLTQVPGQLGRWGRYALYYDMGQNTVQVGRGGWDMYQNGPTLGNGLQIGGGLLGLGGNFVTWRNLPPVVAPRSAGAATAAGREPHRIYSARELIRRAEEPGPFHNFPESFNTEIFRGNRQVISENYILYTQRGSINGVEGTFEIGVRPSASGRIEVIVHRFFRPDPRR